jgi:glutamate synthase domain-containing protein 1
MQQGINRSNPYGDDKEIAACSIFGMMDTSGKRFSGRDVVKAIGNMHDRGNGLGGGFAAYGLYPEHADRYAFHVMYLNGETREKVEQYIQEAFRVVWAEPIPTRPARGIVDPPLTWRYFAEVREEKLEGLTEEDYVVGQVMAINTLFGDSFVFSSGKNMGVFKGVGFPEQVAEFFQLEEYEGYLWTAHGRFPTNSQAWWGGAHPFNILDWTVVHNGEISSYGTNRRYLEMFGYHCTMQTDTEVIAYAVDLLARKHRLPMSLVANVLAPPLWTEIDHMPVGERELQRTLRQVYSSLLLNGPFTVILAKQGEMIGLTDRIRLRPLTIGVKGDVVYLSSEESAIRLISRDLDRTWIPVGGEPVVARLKTPLSPATTKAVETIAA